MVITYDKFDYEWFRNVDRQPRKRGNQSTIQKYYYKDIVTAFDIETTRIKAIEQSVMYIWQWQFGDKCTVIGRTWYEFREFLNKLHEELSSCEKLLVFVHNLSYEFSFLKGIYPFESEEVFAVDKRKVLKCSMYGWLEFRCSYMHSNMSLAKYLEKMGVKDQKLSGDEFDYNKERYWFTELTERELLYCINDVRGLVEAITAEMKLDQDNFYTFPLTSTGYVRRDAKKVMKQVSHTFVHDQLPDYNIYKMLREAFRGGNTHANRYYSGVIMHNMHSADRSSSYPDVLCNCRFPISKFFYTEDISFEKIEDLIFNKDKAVLMRVILRNVRLLDERWGFPYIATSKCRGTVKNGVYDNGRVISADYLETTITDIDLKILLEEYDFDIEITTAAYARYGYLPQPFVECVIKYYRDKTELKDKGTTPEEKEENDYYYMKSKNKLNSLYGMMAQDPLKIDILYKAGEDDEFIEDPDSEPEKILEDHNRNAFLAYQWGVWCTAWARYRLEEGLRLTFETSGAAPIYCDTDSCKYIGVVDWSEYNKQRVHDSEVSGAHATDAKGHEHYMGVFESEDDMKRFKTLGAKKYAYENNGKLHITIAGVNKKKGAVELVETAREHGADPLDLFAPGFVFYDAGGVEAVYNDKPEIKEYTTPEGDPVRITSNVVLKETTKTLGITEEYRSLLQNCKSVNMDIERY